MRTNSTQGLLWSFITCYKRYTGESLSYIQLAQHPEVLRRHLDAARLIPHPDMAEIVEALDRSLGTKAAPDTGDQRPARRSQTTARQDIAQERAARDAWVVEEYTSLVRTALDPMQMPLEGRQQMDHFCRRQRLDAVRADVIEEAVRAELGLPERDWAQEMRDNLAALTRHGPLSERDRLQLFETYLRKGRLSVTEAEALIRDVAPVATNARPGGGSRVALVASLFAVVISLGLFVSEPLGRLVGLDVADAEEQPAELKISGSILQSTVWRAGTTYHLQGIVFVEAGARLTIEPGTRILGDFGSALIVTRDATLYARGTADAPIVFTSAKPVGQRQPGDWGGVVLLGNAPVNHKDAQIEGVDASDIRGRFGGQDITSNCGVLEYVRIEFAGHEVFANNELNGLTLGGCGNTSIIRHVQVHRGSDDGVEVFGGDVDLKHIVITGAEDDSLDWDMGWTGRVQFLVIQQHGDAGDSAFEADNSRKDHNAQPRSAPTIYNATLIGSRNPERAQRAIVLRLGTAGTFRNFIVDGFPLESIDIRDKVTAALADVGELSFSHMMLHHIGKDGRGFFSPEGGDKDDDNGFDEAGYFAGSARQVLIGEDPRLPAAVRDPLAPTFVPAGGSPAAAASAAIPQDEFWDQAANFLGAIRPGSTVTWLDGWTAFPAN